MQVSKVEETKDLFHRSSLHLGATSPLRNSLGGVFFNSLLLKFAVFFNHFLTSTLGLLSLRRRSETFTNFPQLTTTWGLTSNHLDEPPRVTNAPKLLDNQTTSAQAMDWLFLDSLLLSTSSQDHSIFPLNPIQKICKGKLKSHKEMLGEVCGLF